MPWQNDISHKSISIASLPSYAAHLVVTHFFNGEWSDALEYETLEMFCGITKCDRIALTRYHFPEFKHDANDLSKMPYSLECLHICTMERASTRDYKHFISFTDGMFGEVFELGVNNKPAVIQASDNLPQRESSFLEAIHVKTVLCVPIMLDKMIWGCVFFCNCHENREWKSHEIETIHEAIELWGAAAACLRKSKILLQREALLSAVGRLSEVLLQDVRQCSTLNRDLTNLEIWPDPSRKANLSTSRQTASFQQHGDINFVSILKTLGEAACVDRAYIFNRTDLSSRFNLKECYEWSSPGVVPSKSIQERIFYHDDWKEIIDLLAFGEPAILHRETLQEGLVQDRIFALFEIETLILIPVFVNGEFWGGVGFDSCIRQRHWLETEIEILFSIAKLIGAALTHSKNQLEIQRKDLLLECAAFSSEKFLKDALCSNTCIEAVLTHLENQLGASCAYLYETQIDPDGRLIGTLRHETHCCEKTSKTALGLSQYVFPGGIVALKSLLKREVFVAQLKDLIAIDAKNNHSARKRLRHEVPPKEESILWLPIDVQGTLWVLGFDDAAFIKGSFNGQLSEQEKETLISIADIFAGSLIKRAMNEKLLVQDRLLATVEYAAEKFLHLDYSNEVVLDVLSMLAKSVSAVSVMIVECLHQEIPIDEQPDEIQMHIKHEYTTNLKYSYKETSYKIGKSLFKKWLNKSKTQNIVYTNNKLLSPQQRDFYTSCGIHSLFLAPLIIQKHFCGWMIIHFKERPLSLDKSQMNLLMSSANLYSEFIARDLTRRDIARQAAMIESLLDASPDHIFYQDCELRYIGGNTAFLNFVNQTRASITGKTDKELESSFLSGADVNPHEVLERGISIRAEQSLLNQQGNMSFWDIVVAPVKNEDGRPIGILGINRDITQLKKFQEELLAAKEEAERANRVKSGFLANMSHEIRTPLNGVIGSASLLSRTLTDHKQARHAKRIMNSAEMLLSIINDILDFSKIEAGRIELEHSPFNLHHAIESMVESFAIQCASKGLEIASFFSKGLPQTVISDQTRICQVLNNLLSNAVKFTEQGSIIVRCERTQGPESNRVYVQISVIDEGIGISEEQQTKIFKPFSQADTSTTRKYGGTGLGLVISRNFVEMIGGTIGVESIPHKGSCFWFTLPFITDGTTAFQHDVQPIPSRRVLIVDPHPVARHMLETQLQEFGFETTATTSVADAIELLEASLYLKNYDFLLIDSSSSESGKTFIQLQQLANNQKIPFQPINEYDLIRMIRNTNEFDSLGIILMTSEEDDDIEQVIQLLNVENLVKPIQCSALLSAIQRITQTIQK